MTLDIYTPGAYTSYADLLKRYNELKENYDNLSEEFNNLTITYNDLNNRYEALEEEYTVVKISEFNNNPNIHLQQLSAYSFRNNPTESEFMNNVDIVGALLSFNSSNQTFTIWNCNLDEWNPYNEWTTPSDALPIDKTSEYGTLIAVCVGKGLWCNVTIDSSIIWGNHLWASVNTLLYNEIQTKTLITKSGYENTNYIITNSSNLENTVWYQIRVNTSYIPSLELANKMYIPSVIELSEMQQNISKRYSENTSINFYPFDYGKLNIGYLIFKQLLEPTIKAVVLISSTDNCISEHKYTCYDFRLCKSDVFDKNNGNVYMVDFIHF